MGGSVNHPPMTLDIFICPVCLNLLFQPVTLPCGNSVCAACLASFLSTTRHPSAPPAPSSPSSWRRDTHGSSSSGSLFEQASSPSLDSPPLSSGTTATTGSGGGAGDAGAGLGCLSDDSDAPCRPPPAYPCPVPSCRASRKMHRDRGDAVDVTLKRILETCFPKDMEAMELVATGLKRLENVRREHISRQGACASALGSGKRTWNPPAPLVSSPSPPPPYSTDMDVDHAHGVSHRAPSPSPPSPSASACRPKGMICNALRNAPASFSAFFGCQQAANPNPTPTISVSKPVANPMSYRLQPGASFSSPSHHLLPTSSTSAAMPHSSVRSTSASSFRSLSDCNLLHCTTTSCSSSPTPQPAVPLPPASSFPSLAQPQPSTGADSIPTIILTCFNRAIAIAPHLARAYVARAQAYLMLGYLGPAKADCKVAVMLKPGAKEVVELQKRIEDMGRCTGLDASPPAECVCPDNKCLEPPTSTVINACAQNLECTLCFSMMGDPVTAPCGHSWCRCCLLMSLTHSNACPLCRRSLPPYNYFEKRPRNGVLVRLLEFVQAAMKAFRGGGTNAAVASACGSVPEMSEVASASAAAAAAAATKTMILPIFVGPLVFPGVPCYMHIFEPRYRGMVKRLIAEGQTTFGLCLPEPAAGYWNPAEAKKGYGATSTSSATSPLANAAMGDGAAPPTEESGVSSNETTPPSEFPSTATVGVCTGGACQRYLPIGTLLKIRSCEPVVDAGAGGCPSSEEEDLPRYLIEAVGVSRFRVLQRGVSEGGYNVALVERVEDTELDDDEAGCGDDEAVDEAASEKSGTVVNGGWTTASTGSDMDVEMGTGDDKMMFGKDEAVRPPGGMSTDSEMEEAEEEDDRGFLLQCPVTAFFTSHFRLPVRPSAMRPSSAHAADVAAGSSSPSMRRDRSGGSSGGSSLATTTNELVPPALLARSQSGSSLGPPRSHPSSPSLSEPSTIGGGRSGGRGTRESSVNPLSVVDSTKPLNPLRRKAADPYSRLSILRCQLLGLLASLPPQVRLHLELLYGPAPTDPDGLSFWVANIAPVGEYRKYEILKCTSVPARVEMVVDMYEGSGILGRLEAGAAALMSKSAGRGSAGQVPAAGAARSVCVCPAPGCPCRGQHS
ncbi:hypothetical protein HDU96_007295 [Phlyctochytrium bullatum]|nr:hypothetical protein HDU96_007295 [Phlyctochytrium bullatum]